MPPWKPEPRRQAEFIGARRLTPQQIATLERWVADGALEGDLTRSAGDTGIP